MTKNSPQKPSDEFLLSIQEKAREDLAKLMSNSSLLESIKAQQKTFEQLRKSFDFESLGKNMAVPLENFSQLAKQISTLSENFKITIPEGLLETIKNVNHPVVIPRTETMTYIPRNDRNIESVETNLTKFIQKVERRMEEGFRELSQTIDKNSGDYKIKMVTDKNARCPHCDCELMRVQFMVYFGKASMKCPKCKKIVKVPDELRFSELK